MVAVSRTAGAIHFNGAGARCVQGRGTFRARADNCARAAGKILGTPRGDQHGAPLARPGQVAASSRSSCSDLRLVYGGFRDARSERGQGLVKRSGIMRLVAENVAPAAKGSKRARAYAMACPQPKEADR